MPRRSTFTVDASGVQGNPGATVTFKALTIREHREWRESSESTDYDLLSSHVVSWSGFVDDDGNEMPSPEHEPDILAELYYHEQAALLRLFFEGPDGASAKN
jgi:hypothetical protein